MTTPAVIARWLGYSKPALLRAAVSQWRISSAFVSPPLGAIPFGHSKSRAVVARKLFRYDLQIIEIGDRIRLRPQTDFAGIFEGVICRFDLLCSIVIANELVTHCFHT